MHWLPTFQKGLLIGECILLGYFTEYFSIANPSHQDTRNAYLYASGKRWALIAVLIIISLPPPPPPPLAAIVAVTFALATFYAHGSLVAQKTGMMARIMVTAAVYTKVMNIMHFNRFFLLISLSLH